jgi:light-regulated signal transduction histidine kinase (bacteriophytochrome)
MVRGLGHQLEMQEPKRHVELDVKDHVEVVGDPRLLQAVLQNLLANAWKFTSHHPSAHIQFGVEKNNGTPVYFVKDDGAGFDMAYKNKLFGAFQRLHRTSEFPGNGIGLATVQRIIHRHGGKIWAEGAVEKGATMYFTLGEQPDNGSNEPTEPIEQAERKEHSTV